MTDDEVKMCQDDENYCIKFQVEVSTALRYILRFYEEKKIFLWNVDEEQLSEILVKALHENDKMTKTKVSQIALLNLALSLG